jgi:hypothetical protein
VQHRRHAYQQARKDQQTALSEATEQMNAIVKGLEHLKTIDVNALLLKDMPAPIVQAGHTVLWKKSMSDWEALMAQLKIEMKMKITHCQAFIAATETVPVVIYDLVSNKDILKLCMIC